ncbi:peptide-methionine (S)-S-oxide reductase MsrA [Clostridium cellulovorans]|uniref:Peptide methionine sulfoxide reductase MsrA n=1 Tax=Clostridium cellulovorans (strain ATCC 35296 / DSM 3052 / OCM 3 / 743B) TaxID=573061 RepID=D9SR76_CLOC7|nr:peptide-methionine (S)-S-oxide reductase MsrA [Clostridium cellulovorans]ADL50364.1 peptide methionine sulfoxide reductase [Clostridium cellulovorans 743B]
MKEIIVAGGCFWGVEEFFSRIPGILDTEVGYANGVTENPTYEDVCKNNTGFAEACYIKYDEAVLPLDALLEQYWSIIEPTYLNRQGNDIGSQYRTGLYYKQEEDKEILLKSKEEIQKQYDEKVVTEVDLLKNFYIAEEYHQDYLKKNPNGYCHIKLD